MQILKGSPHVTLTRMGRLLGTSDGHVWAEARTLLLGLWGTQVPPPGPSPAPPVGLLGPCPSSIPLLQLTQKGWDTEADWAQVAAGKLSEGRRYLFLEF